MADSVVVDHDSPDSGDATLMQQVVGLRGLPTCSLSYALVPSCPQLKVANQTIARLRLSCSSVVDLSLEELRSLDWTYAHQQSSAGLLADDAAPSTPTTSTSGQKRPRLSTTVPGVRTSPSGFNATPWSAADPRELGPSPHATRAAERVPAAAVDAPSQTSDSWPASSAPVIAELSSALAAARGSTSLLREALGDAVAQLEVALGLVAGIPPLAARCAELEALVDETQLLARIAGSGNCSCCGGGAQGPPAPSQALRTAVVHEAPSSLGELCGVGTAVGSDYALPTAAGDSAPSALKARLALMDLELQHAKGVAAELQAQVRRGRGCGGA